MPRTAGLEARHLLHSLVSAHSEALSLEEYLPGRGFKEIADGLLENQQQLRKVFPHLGRPDPQPQEGVDDEQGPRRVAGETEAEEVQT